jgi:16S rRNA (uracil1498-N3)-methyltransferase
MKHTFACYVQNLNTIINSVSTPQVELNNPEIYRRLIEILRLEVGEEVILFDETINAQILLTNSSKKKTVAFRVILTKQNTQPSPHISFLQSLTKKEAFEEIIYYAAQMGVNEIFPILSAKSSKNWWTAHEFERLQRIMISACEQSKNFIIPKLYAPVEISKSLNSLSISPTKICFDEDGLPLMTTIQKVTATQPTQICLFCGSESGLTAEELELLKQNNFLFCKLTPTILRAKEAACIGIGIWRSLL